MSVLVRRGAPLLLAALTLLAACKGGGAPIEHPEGDALVLRITNQGGFVPAEYIFTNAPTFSLLGDGRVVVPGAQVAIYPGPAFPSVMVRQLTESGIQAVLAEVEKTRLFGKDAEYLGAQNYVADAQDTVFTLHAGGREVTIRVYALGIVSPGESHPGISAEELAAHAALLRLSDRLTTLELWLPADAWAGPSSAYKPDAMRLLVRNADGDQPDSSGIPYPLVAWPTAEDPATFGAPINGGTGSRCGVVAGPDAQAWYDTLAAANQLTRYTYGGHRYQVSVRFFLPDEPLECPAGAY